MIIDKNSINSTSFSFYTNKELEQQDCIKQIDFILEKYNILENDNQLISSVEKNVLYTINFIVTLFIKKEKIPENLDLIQVYYDWYQKGYRIDLRKVKGHVGNRGNELVDKLAKGEINTFEEAKMFWDTYIK